MFKLIFNLYNMCKYSDKLIVITHKLVRPKVILYVKTYKLFFLRIFDSADLHNFGCVSYRLSISTDAIHKIFSIHKSFNFYLVFMVADSSTTSEIINSTKYQIQSALTINYIALYLHFIIPILNLNI